VHTVPATFPLFHFSTFSLFHFSTFFVQVP
jgi:hypothetical protein